MKEHYQIWLKAIEESNTMSENDKNAFSKVVIALSKSGAPVIFNVKHLALLIGVDFRALKRMLYVRDRFYRSFSIKKRNGGERLIEAPYPSLKMVQRWILDNILVPSAFVHPCSVGFISKKTITDNARPHLGHSVLLKMDIKDFFPSVTEELVRSYFSNLGYRSDLASTLAYLCCKDGRLPQGSPTSPMLSNVLFYEMDNQLSKIAFWDGLSYTRYADDLAFSGDRIRISIIDNVAAIVLKYGLRINNEKTRRSGSTSRKIITGVSVSSGEKLTIPREVKRVIRQKVFYVLKYGLTDHLKHIQSRDLLAGYRLLGLLAYWHSVEPENKYVLDSSKALGEMLRGE
ncbi:MAG: retron St85 family RNA-directed DNA polymerase [Prevotella sp.]|nr:retron St85 family RNA-directed DNA polymerase [Prevotella sp.]